MKYNSKGERSEIEKETAHTKQQRITRKKKHNKTKRNQTRDL